MMLGGKKVATTKFEYALLKMQVQIVQACTTIEKEYTAAVSDIRTLHASDDSNGNLIVENDQYKYTKEATVQMNAALRKLQDERSEQSIFITPFYAKGPLPVLTEFQVNAFRGLILPDNYEIPEPEDISATMEVFN